jgi:hypothetical protein
MRPSADAMADLLVNRYKLARLTKLSLIACWGGGEAYDPSSVNRSFAQRLHWLLLKTYQIETELTARTERMVTKPSGQHFVRRPDGVGVKGPMEHQQFGAKYIFSWRNGFQTIRPAYGHDLDLLFGD